MSNSNSNDSDTCRSNSNFKDSDTCRSNTNSHDTDTFRSNSNSNDSDTCRSNSNSNDIYIVTHVGPLMLYALHFRPSTTKFLSAPQQEGHKSLYRKVAATSRMHL